MSFVNKKENSFPFPPAEPGDTRMHILVEAAKLFAQKGYARATTRALAAAAGVTEVTLFRHFNSKEKLFEEAARQFGGAMVSPLLEEQLTGDDFKADLQRFGLMFIKIFLERRAVIRMMLCESIHFPNLTQNMSENPRMLRKLIASYMQQQIDRGSIRRVQVETVAQGFIGMLFSYGLLADMLTDAEGEIFSTEEYVEDLVDVFTHGLLLEER